MEYVYLRPDEKRRLYLPKEFEEEFGIDSCPVKVEKKKEGFFVHKHEHFDAIADLARIGEKIAAFKGKTPLQLKREAQDLMAKEMGK